MAGTYTPKPEHVLQASCAQFFKAHMVPECVWSAVDHGITFKGDGLQRANAWNRLAARGVKPSIPDFPIMLYRGHAHAIEMKAGDGKLDEGQAEWGRRWVAAGGTWDVCHSRREVWDSMCRAFPDNPLKPPPALLQMWLAKDGEPVAAKPIRTPSKPRPAKASARQVERGNRFALMGIGRR